MFAMIALGVLLGGSARGATTCGVSHSTMRGAPWVSRGSCPSGRATQSAGRTTQSARRVTQVKEALTGQPVPCVVRMHGARLLAPPPAARSPAPALRAATC
jgi:hypothetical protein